MNMNKKEAAAKVIVKAKPTSRKNEQINQMLIENFVSLQKVMTNMTVKFDMLANNMSKLLNLFEMSARSFMSSPSIAEAEKDKEFLDKLNSLLDQNKTIAKGLTLMEEKFRERVYGGVSQEQPMPQFSPAQNSNIKRLPRM
jgi:hypothetical protein